MPPRLLSLRARILPLAALAGVHLFGCSSKGPQDKNLGTDAGLGFVPPDVPIRTDTAPDRAEAAASESAGLDSAALDGAVEREPAAAPDGALPLDAAVDAADEGV
jgi:hypothetical protein